MESEDEEEVEALLTRFEVCDSRITSHSSASGSREAPPVAIEIVRRTWEKKRAEKSVKYDQQIPCRARIRVSCGLPLARPVSQEKNWIDIFLSMEIKETPCRARPKASCYLAVDLTPQDEMVLKLKVQMRRNLSAINLIDYQTKPV
ncbi:hypothetical protein HAX54_029418, partial [Datura stramonium]|nr:hypothetical protein [Datura stramonium]